LMACSSGIVTADSTVCAFAPMYTLVTTTCGGERLGNSAIGSVGIAIAPPSTISKAQTVANTGRRMKKSTNKFQSSGQLRQRSALDSSRTNHDLSSNQSACHCARREVSWVPHPSRLLRTVPTAPHPAPALDSRESIGPVLSSSPLCGDRRLMRRRSSRSRGHRRSTRRLLHHRYSILQKLQARSDDVIPGLNTVNDRIVVSDGIANAQQSLPRHGILPVIHRQKREKLPIDPR